MVFQENRCVNYTLLLVVANNSSSNSLMEQKRKKALVVGALGIIGRNLIDHLSSLNDWEIGGKTGSVM